MIYNNKLFILMSCGIVSFFSLSLQPALADVSSRIVAAQEALVQGRPFESEREYLIALREEPGNELATMGLANLYFSLSMPQDVLETLNELPNQGRDIPESLMLKGLTYRVMGDLAQAGATYTRLLAVASDDPEALSAIAGHFTYIGDTVSAERISTIRDCLVPEEGALKPGLVCNP